MATEDMGGLFAATSPGSTPRSTTNSNSQAETKRIKLRPWDTAAAQLLNPYGHSDVLHMTQAELWKAVAEGSTKAQFHSELAATEETGGNYRVGIGLSRFAETMLVAIEDLKKPIMTQLIQETPLASAKNEANELEPHFKILSVGKGRQEDTQTSANGFGKLRKRKARQQDAPAVSAQETEEAAKQIYQWLTKPQSPLRSILAILSSGAAFYAASVSEKVARAWVSQKPATIEDAVTAAIARTGGEGPAIQAGIDDDTAGLFG